MKCGEADLTYAGYIDGKFVRGEGAELIVENPSDESVVEALPGVSVGQIDAAIHAARRAFETSGWKEKPTAERAAIMRRYVAALADRIDVIRDYAVREGGCPIGTGSMAAQTTMPLRQAADIIDLFETLPDYEENPLPLRERLSPFGGVIQSLRRYTPIGVVAGIPANNVPFYTAMWKVVPALIAGNAIVLRPNPLTPLSSKVFAEAAEEAGLAPGLVNVVMEAGLEGGQLMSTHGQVDMVAFTGSSAVGAAVMAQAAPTMKRLQLELGGKSAQIFLPDSIDKVTAQAMVICTAHAGQGCALGTRIFVPEEKKGEILEKIAEAIAKVRIGRADDPETQLGPVVSAAQRDRCERYVRLATENGGRVVIGGKRPAHLDKGFFFEPTLLDLPDNKNPAAQDEIFGPIPSIIGYRDLDHAVEMANDSRFGLSGYVHGQDKATSLKVALAIRSGTVHCNGTIASAYASAGGQRMSGLGRERGIEGLREYQQMSCLTLG